jgi:hypothetical protein
MVQKEYKTRHDWVGKRMHWDICKKYNIHAKEKWYEHEPEPVIEYAECKILLVFNIQTDCIIEARRPDLVIVDKVKNICQILDFAVPYDTRVNMKESEKIEKYQDLARELKKNYGTRKW